MKKRVLLAIDLEAPASRAASYAVQLAARLELSLILMAILAPPRRQAAAAQQAVTMAELREEQRLWLGKIRERCQQEGVEVEIFISAGAFLSGGAALCPGPEFPAIHHHGLPRRRPGRRPGVHAGGLTEPAPAVGG